MVHIGCIMRKEHLDGQPKWFINDTYVKAFDALNCALYPICTKTSLDASLRFCDALLIPGGYDLHGYYQNVSWNEHSTYYPNTMDYFDFLCIDAYVKKNKSILGICRGLQLLNVYFHGTLTQHIDTNKHCVNHYHMLSTIENSTFQQLYPSKFKTNSYHHQVIEKLGDNLLVQAISEEGYIEAILHQTLPILGVQWHPERMEDDQILPYFLHLVFQARSSLIPAINEP